MVNKIQNNDNWLGVLDKLIMDKQTFKVPQVIAPYIYPIQYFTYDHPNVDCFTYRPIPIGTIVLYIHCNAPVKINDAKSDIYYEQSTFIVGIHKIENIVNVQPTGRGEMIAVAFKPGGFAKLFNLSANKVQNTIVAVNKYLNSELLNNIKQVKLQKTPNDRINKTISFLKLMLKNSSFKTRKNHLNIIDKIQIKNGCVVLKKLCDEMNINLRAVERSFHLNIGISPKEYIRIIRFNNVLSALYNGSFKNWHELIYNFGYYDQSHFIHDFKTVTGFTPNNFMINNHKAKSIYLDRFGLLKYELPHKL